MNEKSAWPTKPLETQPWSSQTSGLNWQGGGRKTRWHTVWINGARRKIHPQTISAVASRSPSFVPVNEPPKHDCNHGTRGRFDCKPSVHTKLNTHWPMKATSTRNNPIGHLHSHVHSVEGFPDKKVIARDDSTRKSLQEMQLTEKTKRLMKFHSKGLQVTPAISECKWQFFLEANLTQMYTFSDSGLSWKAHVSITKILHNEQLEIATLCFTDLFYLFF